MKVLEILVNALFNPEPDKFVHALNMKIKSPYLTQICTVPYRPHARPARSDGGC